jgi:hypothetical protein
MERERGGTGRIVIHLFDLFFFIAAVVLFGAAFKRIWEILFFKNPVIEFHPCCCQFVLSDRSSRLQCVCMETWIHHGNIENMLFVSMGDDIPNGSNSMLLTEQHPFSPFEGSVRFCTPFHPFLTQPSIPTQPCYPCGIEYNANAIII